LAEKRSRFLPGDPRVEEPYRLTPQLALRVAVLGFLALTIFAVMAAVILVEWLIRTYILNRRARGATTA